MNFQQKAIEVIKERFALPVSDIYVMYLKVQFIEHNRHKLTICDLDADFPTRNFTFILQIDPNLDKYDDVSYRDMYSDAIAFMQTYDINVDKHALFIYELLGNVALIEICTNLIQHDKEQRTLNISLQALFGLTKKGEFSDTMNAYLHALVIRKKGREKIFTMQNFKRIYDQVKEYIPEEDE